MLQDGGIFLQGRFDRFQSGDAYGVLTEALAGIANVKNYQETEIKAVRKALGEDAPLLLAAIPALSTLLTSSEDGNSQGQEERSGQTGRSRSSSVTGGIRTNTTITVHNLNSDASIGSSQNQQNQNTNNSIDTNSNSNNVVSDDSDDDFSVGLVDAVIRSPNSNSGNNSRSTESDGTSNAGHHREQNVKAGWGFERLKMQLGRFLQALCKTRRIVLFLDDLQWSDKSYTSLISSFLLEKTLSNFLLVATYRSNELGEDHMLFKDVRRLQGLSNSSLLHVEDLNHESALQLVSSLLRIDPPSAVEDLTGIIHKKTRGNPFFMVQMLQKLERSGVLCFNAARHKWEYDIAQVQLSTSLCDNLVDLIGDKITQLPEAVQTMLQVASCLGNRFDPAILTELLANINKPPAITESLEDVVKMLDECTEEGLLDKIKKHNHRHHLHQSNHRQKVLPVADASNLNTSQHHPAQPRTSTQSYGSQSEDGLDTEDEGSFCLLDHEDDEYEEDKPQFLYKFSHDKIQQGSYTRISPQQRRSFHHIIGTVLRGLLQETDGEAEEHDWLLLVATDQLNRGETVFHAYRDRVDRAWLNMQAAELMRSKSAFFPASDFCDHALRLLGEDRWFLDYQAALEAVSLGVELDYCCGKNQRCTARVGEVLEHANTLHEKLRVYFTLLDLFSINRNHNDALAVGYDLVKEIVGIHFPKRPSTLSVLSAFLSTLRAIGHKTDEELSSLPPMHDDDVLSSIRIMTNLLSPAFFSNRLNDFALLVCSMMKLTIQHGSHPMIGATFCSFGGLCMNIGKVDLAFRFGRLGDTLNAQAPERRKFICKSICNYYGFVYHMRNSYYNSLNRLLEAHRIGMEVSSFILLLHIPMRECCIDDDEKEEEQAKRGEHTLPILSCIDSY